MLLCLLERIVILSAMKYANSRGFEKHLKEASPDHFAPVYLLVNKEEYERKEAAAKLSAALLDGLPHDDNHLKKMNASSHSVQSLLQELGSFNFFAKKRLILVDQAQEFKKEDTARLESYLAQPFPSVYLIFSATAINRATRFYKQIEKIGVILDVDPEKPWEKDASLVEFTIKWLRQESISISQSVAQILVRSINQDRALLMQELEKLLNYLGERQEITAQDLQMIGAGHCSQTAWQLGDAIFTRRGSQALEISHQLLNDGEPLISLLRALRSQFQTRLMGATCQPEEVQARFPYLRGQMLHKQIEQARNYGSNACRKGLLFIDEAELMTKNSSLSPELLLEKLIFKLVVL
jgi:DNA polymerase III subunit delta